MFRFTYRVSCCAVMVSLVICGPCPGQLTADELDTIEAMLLEASADEDVDVRIAAFSAMDPTTEKLVDVFRRALSDPSEVVRHVALRKLIERNEVTDDILRQALRVPSTAFVVSKYLRKIGAPAVSLLLDAAKQNETKRLAAGLFGEIKLGEHREAVAQTLVILAKDQDAKVRAAAVESLGKLADPNYGIDINVLHYYEGFVRKYDTNGDGVLSQDEWKMLKEDPSAADVDDDDRITPAELARWHMKKKE